MKITGPGSTTSPQPTQETSDGKPAVSKAGKAFAEKLGGAQGPSGPSGPGAITDDISARLKTGSLDAKAAVEHVLERVLDRQLGANAPAPIREQVRAALQDAIATDPLLIEKVKALGG